MHAEPRKRNINLNRRAGVYPLVLIVSAAAVTAALTGLASRSATESQSGLNRSLMHARHAARSGIEIALEVLAEQKNWRDRYAPEHSFSYAIGDAKVTVSLDDPFDSDLGDSEEDPYRVVATAEFDGARAIAEATVSIEQPPTFAERAESLSPIAFWELTDPENTTDASPRIGSQQGFYTSSTASGQTEGPDGQPAPIFDSTVNAAFVPHFNDLLLDNGSLVFHARVNRSIADIQSILTKDIQGENGSGSIHIYFDRRGQAAHVRMERSDTSPVTLQIGRLTPGSWYQIGITFGRGGLSVYLDGAEQNRDSSWTTGLGSNAGPGGNTHPLNFGAWFTNSTWTNSMNGSVRDVVIYDYQLDASQFEFLATQKTTTTAAIGPDAWRWKTD